MIIVITLLHVVLIGQSPYPFNNPLVVNNIDGLQSSWVTTVAEDEDGFAWIGTIDGLARFDGTNTELFLPNDEDSTAINSSEIVDIVADNANDKIWITTNSGLSVFHISTKTFTNYKYDSADIHSPPDSKGTHILKDRSGTIWIGYSKGGMVEYQPETDNFIRHVCLDSLSQFGKAICNISVIDIQEDLYNDDLLWLGTNKGLLAFSKSKGTYETYIFSDEDDQVQQNLNSHRFMHIHPNGKIYYAIWWNGVCVFDIASKTFSKLDPCYINNSEAIGRDLINGFHADTDSTLYINGSKGLQRYNINTGCIDMDLRNASGAYYSYDHVDRHGRIWTATHGGGLKIYNPLLQQVSTEFYEPQGNSYPSFTTATLEDTLRNRIYTIGQYTRGLFIYNLKDATWELIPPPLDLEIDKVGGFNGMDMAYMAGEQILISCAEGLFYFEPGFVRLQWYPVQPEKAMGRLSYMAKDHDNNFWILNEYDRLLKLDVAQQKIISYKDKIADLSEKLIRPWHITVDKNNNIWMTAQSGLLIYDRANDNFIYHHADDDTNLAFKDMSTLYGADDGYVWIATFKPYLAYGHADSLNRGIIRLVDNNHGAVDGEINHVRPYGSDLLLYSENFVQRYDPSNHTVKDKIAKDYGLGTLMYNSSVLTDGQIVTGKTKGIIRYNWDDIRKNKEKPQAYVTDFRVFDNSWPIKYGLLDTNNIKLSYTQNFFSFSFSALGYNIPEDFHFRYQLEGFDQGWQDGTLRKFAAYTNVPGGDYRFLVQATNNEGALDAPISTTHIHISTIWWKSTWFWIIAALFIGAIILAGNRYLVTQARKEERLKSDYEKQLADMELSALRAQMNPHFIFNSLNSIEYYIINNDPEKASDYLNRFSRLIRLILQNSKSTIVPLKDDLEALRLYIEIESMRFDDLFDYEVHVEKGLNIESISLPPLIIQPYVENAIWHGLMQQKDRKGKLTISLRRTPGHLICSIEDNGIGREAAAKIKSKSITRKKSYGMKITSDRLVALNELVGGDASVNVFDLKDDNQSAVGTRVELVIPTKSKTNE